VVRAKALLQMAEGVPTNEVIRRCLIGEISVCAWRRLSAKEGLDW
jgi:hypothetical protein